MAFQFLMIAHVDDATQFLVDNLSAHERFPNQAIKAKLNWSNNVNDKHDAPLAWQMLLGAMDLHIVCY